MNRRDFFKTAVLAASAAYIKPAEQTIANESEEVNETDKMFRGVFYEDINSNRQIKLPSSFHSILQSSKGNFTLVKMEGTIRCYNAEMWHSIEKHMLENESKLKSIICGRTYHSTCDPVGFITIPKDFCIYAGLKRNVVVVGVLDRFEIWAYQNWHAQTVKLETEFHSESIQNEISNIGL